MPHASALHQPKKLGCPSVRAVNTSLNFLDVVTRIQFPQIICGSEQEFVETQYKERVPVVGAVRLAESERVLKDTLWATEALAERVGTIFWVIAVHQSSDCCCDAPREEVCAGVGRILCELS